MLLDKKAILQEIIDRDGNCEDFSGAATCKRCPLGSKIVDGKRKNCMDFLNISEEMSEDAVADIYKRAAEEELFTMDLEDYLKE